MNAAKSARLFKDRRPELHCSAPGCLWRLSSGDCPKHPARACKVCGVPFTSVQAAMGKPDTCIECASFYASDAPASALYDNEAGR